MARRPRFLASLALGAALLCGLGIRAQAQYTGNATATLTNPNQLVYVFHALSGSWSIYVAGTNMVVGMKGGTPNEQFMVFYDFAIGVDSTVVKEDSSLGLVTRSFDNSGYWSRQANGDGNLSGYYVNGPATFSTASASSTFYATSFGGTNLAHAKSPSSTWSFVIVIIP